MDHVVIKSALVILVSGVLFAILIPFSFSSVVLSSNQRGKIRQQSFHLKKNLKVSSVVYYMRKDFPLSKDYKDVQVRANQRRGREDSSRTFLPVSLAFAGQCTLLYTITCFIKQENTILLLDTNPSVKNSRCWLYCVTCIVLSFKRVLFDCKVTQFLFSKNSKQNC